MDGTATAILFLGLAATIAAMALPPAYPDAPIRLWRALFWLGIVGTIASTVYLVMANMNWTKIGPVTLMISGLLLFVGGAIWLFARGPVSKAAPTPVHAAGVVTIHPSMPQVHAQTATAPATTLGVQKIPKPVAVPPREHPITNTIGDVTNNSGIVTQGQTGNNSR